MTTNSTAAEDRLAKLGIHLPDAPAPFGAYVPALQTANLLCRFFTLKVPGVRRSALHHRNEYPGRRWVEALKAWPLARATASSDRSGGTAKWQK
jgi:hypothetical protein